MSLKVLEGDEIWNHFGRADYFETALCKMYLTEYDWGSPPIERRFYPTEDVKGDFWIRASYSGQPHVQEILNKLEPNNWYFITVYNNHHQMFFNPTILAINFDCQRNAVIMPWRYDQCYPGYPYKTPEDYVAHKRTFDDYGVPV